MVKLLILFIQLFALIFLVAYFSTNSFLVTFEIKDLLYTFFFKLTFVLFLILIIIFVFVVLFFYFKSSYKIQKYFLLKDKKNYRKVMVIFVEAMIALANKDKNAIIASKKNEENN